MITAGIDMGIEFTKVVIVNNEEVIGRAVASTGGADRPIQARKAYSDALRAAGVSESSVESVIATGIGKFDIPFVCGHITETVAAARAAQFFCKDATAVMSVGADETIAAALGADSPVKAPSGDLHHADTRLVREFALNQKCAAGLGTLVTHLAKRLELPLEKASCAFNDAGAVNDGCIVFSELDALCLLNNGAEPEAVMASVIKAVAVRAATVMNDLTIPAKDCVVLIGGMARNKAFVRALEGWLGINFVIPDDAQYGGAIGAAISDFNNRQ